MRDVNGRERTCQEARPFDVGDPKYIPCGKPAVGIVDNGDERPIWACESCARAYGERPDDEKYRTPHGWLRARLLCEVAIPLDQYQVGHTDATLRKYHEEKLRRRLSHEAVRSILQDRLALSVVVDGVERKVE